MSAPGLDPIQSSLDFTPNALHGNVYPSKTTPSPVPDSVVSPLPRPDSPTAFALPLSIEAIAGLFRQASEHALANHEPLHSALEAGIKVLSELLATAEPRQYAISLALSEQLRSLATPLRLPHAWENIHSALLARIGIATLPPQLVLQRCGGHTLSHAEQFLFRRIPEIGHDILIRFPSMSMLAKTVLYQEKNYDGTGFPSNSVAGPGIPMGSRLLRILVDAAELQEGGRPLQECLREMRYRYGRYDPDLMEDVSNHFRRTGALDGHATTGRPLLLQELEEGQVLSANVETYGGVLVLAPGYTLTNSLIQRLKRFSKIAGIREPIFVHSTPSAPAPAPHRPKL